MQETELIKKNYLELITEELSKIDTDNAENWLYDENPSTKALEEQKVYFWIRLYLSEENKNINIGEDIIIKYQPLGILTEELETKFICYAKKGMEKDHLDEIVNFSQEDDTKILCLMIDSSKVDGNEEIPFIRTLFKTSRHYEYQLLRRDELVFTSKSTGEILEYYDCDF